MGRFGGVKEADGRAVRRGERRRRWVDGGRLMVVLVDGRGAQASTAEMMCYLVSWLSCADVWTLDHGICKT